MRISICTAACLLLSAPLSLAQEAAPAPDDKAAQNAPVADDDSSEKNSPATRSGFDWLTQFEGTWSTKFQGTMTSRVVGKIWIVNELSFPSGPSAVQSIGYDAKKKQFVGTWIDSSSPFIWRYTGSLDSTGKKLILEAEGPDMSDATQTRRYRDTYEFKSDKEIAASSQMMNDQGQWRTMDTGTMSRIDKE